MTVQRTNVYLQHMYKHRSVERGLKTKDKGSAFDEVEEFAIGFPVGFPHPSRFNSFSSESTISLCNVLDNGGSLRKLVQLVS